MSDKIMPADFVGDGDAFARIGVVSSVSTNLICSDCRNRMKCSESPLRKWCNGCQMFGCMNYIKPKIENGACANYTLTALSDIDL